MKTALVTGGAKRIGAAIALGLAKKGYNIALHYHASEKEAKKMASQISRLGVTCKLYKADFESPEETEGLIGQVMQDFPDLQVLINNASIFLFDQFEAHWNINFIAPYLLTKAFAKKIKSGHIINLLDAKVTRSKSRHLTYLLSKKALMEWTRAAALQYAPRIRVNGIAPGVILPPENKTSTWLEKRVQKIPLRMKGDVRYIIQTIDFLLDNPFITGEILFIDGGEHLLG